MCGRGCHALVSLPCPWQHGEREGHILLKNVRGGRASKMVASRATAVTIYLSNLPAESFLPLEDRTYHFFNVVLWQLFLF